MRYAFLLAVPVLALTLAAKEPLPATRPALATAALPDSGEVFRIWPGKAPRATGETPAETPTITCFPPAPGTANGTAVVVCPGGGYTHLASGHEGTDVAKWLAGHGVFGVMLTYRINVPQPAPMLDGQRAVRLVRHHAKDWGINPARIGIMGFSAGGHVASTVGTHYDTGIPGTGDDVQDESCRPDFMLLLYPVISMRTGITHPGSRHVLLGDDAPTKLVDLYSNETQVTTDTPPAFMAASKTDKVVPIQNSVLFSEAMKRRKVPVEFLMFQTGNHGYGMAPGHPELDWTDPCIAWLNGRGLLKPAPVPATRQSGEHPTPMQH